MQAEVTEEEVRVESSLQKVADDNKIKLHALWGLTLYHKADIPFRSGSL